jgi:uncharacterized phage protein (TIGR01671 family)
VFEEWGMEQREIKNPIFLRYTSLKDRNGREIYTGDVVRYKRVNYTDCSRTEIESEEVFVGVIEEWMCAYWLKVDDRRIPLMTIAINEDEKQMEVIGDIYRNPELLEVEKG